MKIAAFASYYVKKCALSNFSSETCGKDGPGIFVKILLPILNLMKVNYELIPVVKDLSGKCHRNGTWLPTDSILGKLSNGTYDMIANPFPFHGHYPCFQRSYYGVFPTQKNFFAKKYDDNTISCANFSIIFEPFDKYVWLCLIVLSCFNILYRWILKRRSKRICLIVSLTSLLFTGLYTGFILTKLFVPPRPYIRNTRQLVQMIKERQIKLIIDKNDDLNVLSKFTKNSAVNDLLNALKKNPPLERHPKQYAYTKQQFNEMVMSGKYAYYGVRYDFFMRDGSNCTVDKIRSSIPVISSKMYFLFYKYSKWMDQFNKAMMNFQDWSEREFMHFGKALVPPGIDQKCFDYEQSLHSTYFVALPITSFFSAFISLVLALIGIFGVFLWERWKFNKGQWSFDLHTVMQASNKSLMTRSISDRLNNQESSRSKKQYFDVKIEKEVLTKFEESWFAFMEELKNSNYDRMNQVEVLNAQLIEMLGGNFSNQRSSDLPPVLKRMSTLPSFPRKESWS